MRLRALLAVAAAVATRPGLWSTALRQARHLAPHRWWSRPPFLPLPATGYLAFRMETMYGDRRRVPTGNDIVTYLEWCRAWPTVTGR